MINEQQSSTEKPEKVDGKDLKFNGRFWCLYTDREATIVNDRLDHASEHRKGAIVFATGTNRFAVMRANGEDYVIYKGKGEGRDYKLGEGNYGRAKFAQNLRTGTWDVVKLQVVCGRNPQKYIDQENRMLELVGQGKGSVRREQKKLKGEKLHTVIAYLKEDGLDEEANELSAQEKNSGYALVTEIVSVVSLAPGDTLTKAIKAQRLTNADSSIYMNMAISVMKAYQQQLQKYGVVHRDIKPDNIMYDKKTNSTVFIDLGMAEELNNVQPEILGTSGYMAPEVENGSKANESTEVYALGRTLRKIFSSGKQEEFAKLIPDDQTRIKVAQLINEMTAKHPHRPTVQQCVQRLEALGLTLTSVAATPISTPTTQPKPPLSEVEKALAELRVSHREILENLDIDSNRIGIFATHAAATTKLIRQDLTMNTAQQKSLNAEVKILLEAVAQRQRISSSHTSKDASGKEDSDIDISTSTRRPDEKKPAITNEKTGIPLTPNNDEVKRPVIPHTLSTVIKLFKHR